MGSRSNEMTNGIRGVRLRVGRSNDSSYEAINNGSSRREKRQPSVKPSNVSAPTSYIFFFLLFYSLIFYLQCYLENHHLPTPLMLDDLKSHPGEFIAERAMERLVKLTNIGPRVAGSYENEVLAVKVLKDEIDEIIKDAKSIHSIEIDIQKYSGSFPLQFLDGLTNVYRGIQDVIVKFGPRKNSGHSLLINCHFDSVVDSPGGSDDGAGCAIMLEILKVLSVSDVQLKNNIIFLFNGAEENLMHGSHGFITQHPWAKEIRAFINLEACGAGGREVLFQSGPNSPWIMETYARNVKYPFASSMAQEVFESRVIPGDTDFRVFRDFGNVSGLDFAWSTNGYVYHTKYDNIDQIPLGSLQRTGDNMLALAKGMVNAHELSNVEKYKEGNLIYFDVLGIFLLRWPEAVGTAINISSILLSFFLLYWSIKDARRKGLVTKSYFTIFFKAFGVVLLGAICSTLVILSTSAFVALIGRSMSWYSRPTWLLFLYVIPSTVTIMALQHYFSVNQLKVVKSKMLLFQIYYDVYQFIWTFILLMTVIFRIRSGYIVWLWVIGPGLGILIQRILGSPITRRPDAKWLLVLLCSLVAPVIQFMAMQVGCLGLFIPIMGRFGAGNNSEIMIALYTNATFGMLLTYVSSLIVLVEKPRKVLTSLSTLFLVAMFLLLFTPLGFPYSGNTHSPKPQRFMMIHTERSFHNRQGKEIGTESGYWIVDHDYNSPHTVKPFVPEMSYAKFMSKDCEKYLYCGYPYLMPVTSFIWKTHWIATNPPKIAVPTSLKVLSRDSIEGKVERITLEIKGPDHMGVIISPKTDVEFVRWSLNEDGPLKGPKWNGQDTYFIYYASSSDPEPWIFSLDFKVSQFNETVMDFALLSHFLHGPQKTGLDFKKLLAQFPPWTAVTSWTATYKSFVL